MYKKLITAAVFIILTLGVNASERFYIPHFVPEFVFIGDGYLQIDLPYEINSDECAIKNRIVVPDDHKYFDHYVSIALTSLVSEKKLHVAVGAPFLGNPSWFQVRNVMALVKN